MEVGWGEIHSSRKTIKKEKYPHEFYHLEIVAVDFLKDLPPGNFNHKDPHRILHTIRQHVANVLQCQMLEHLSSSTVCFVACPSICSKALILHLEYTERVISYGVVTWMK